MIEGLLKMAEDADHLMMVGYGTQSTCHDLQKYVAYAGADVTAASKELRGFIRLSLDGREFDILLAEGPDVDGSRIDLYVSSVPVSVSSHMLERPESLSLSGRIRLFKFKDSEVLAIMNYASNDMVAAVGTGYKPSGTAFPVFEVDLE